MRVVPLCTAIYPEYEPAANAVLSDIFIVPPVRLFQPDVVTVNADELLLKLISFVRLAPVIVTVVEGAEPPCVPVKDTDVVLALSDAVVVPSPETLNAIISLYIFKIFVP